MQNNAFEQEVLKLTNDFRKANGLKSLILDQNLEKAADQHSKDMANGDFFSHDSKDGRKPWDRAQNNGYESGFVGENIAAGYSTPQAVVNGWINSPGHRANMLNPNFNEIGLGYYYLKNDTGSVNYNRYWTQVFGKGTLTTPTPVSKPVPTPKPEPTPEPRFNNRAVIKGTAGANNLIGGTADQVFYGQGGNDVIKARAGDDRLVGGSGNDKLFGQAGNDRLVGAQGNDWLQGASKSNINEKDVLVGGGGGDRFILGNRSGTFYNDGQANSLGLNDYALITKFNQQQGDVIQLSAKHDYRLGAVPQGLGGSQAIFIDNSAGQKDELIGIIQEGAILQLNSSAFAFV
ncbi:MAG: CAP domain-containing protein [Cyanobacteria bacterium J06560_2]